MGAAYIRMCSMVWKLRYFFNKWGVHTCGTLADCCSTLNISSMVLCLSTLVFFLGTRLYVPILLFFFRDENPPAYGPTVEKTRRAITPKHVWSWIPTVKSVVCVSPKWSLAGAGEAEGTAGSVEAAGEAVWAEAGLSGGLWGRWFWTDGSCEELWMSGTSGDSSLALFACLNSLFRSCRRQEPKDFRTTWFWWNLESVNYRQGPLTVLVHLLNLLPRTILAIHTSKHSAHSEGWVLTV